MILRLFLRPSPTIDALYGAIVAQARQPAFYEQFGVPDSVEGRFELIVLHLTLLMRRLKRETEGAERNQALFDAFCRDMDDNLREMGIGDLSVPKHMKRLAEAFYGRVRAYDGALASHDPAALTATFERNVFSGVGRPDDAARLSAYARHVVAMLDWLDGTGLMAVPFPEPGTVFEATMHPPQRPR